MALSPTVHDLMSCAAALYVRCARCSEANVAFAVGSHDGCWRQYSFPITSPELARTIDVAWGVKHVGHSEQEFVSWDYGPASRRDHLQWVSKGHRTVGVEGGCLFLPKVILNLGSNF